MSILNGVTWQSFKQLTIDKPIQGYINKQLTIVSSPLILINTTFIQSDNVNLSDRSIYCGDLFVYYKYGNDKYLSDKFDIYTGYRLIKLDNDTEYNLEFRPAYKLTGKIGLTLKKPLVAIDINPLDGLDVDLSDNSTTKITDTVIDVLTGNFNNILKDILANTVLKANTVNDNNPNTVSIDPIDITFLQR